MKKFIIAAAIISMALSITITAFATTPDIKANNSDSSITLGTSDTLSIDTNMNGSLDMDQLPYNSVSVSVTSNSTTLNVTSEILSSGLEALVIDNSSSNRDVYDNTYQTSIAIDSSGNPFIIYHSENNGISYAMLQDNDWISSVIDSKGIGKYNSIFIDSSDIAHICYDGSGYGEDLYYATYKDGSWNSYKIDGSASVGLENDIALDSTGNVHISHWSWAERSLKYSSNKSGEWVNEVIEPNAGWDQTSIAIDSKDNVHISYGYGAVLRYLSNVSGSWVKTIVHENNSDVTAGGNSVISIDSNGKIHIVSYDWRSFYHSIKEGENWETETVIDYSPEYIKNTSELAMTISNDDSIFATYVVSDELYGMGKLYFTTNKGGNWQSFLLDRNCDYINPSIATDKNGNVHIGVICFVDENNAVLKYINFGLSQSGLSCTYYISPTSKSFDSSGGTGSVSVIVPDGCDWTGTSNDSWITIDSGSSGSGNGTVNYSVSENTSMEEWTGTMTIAENTFTVTQSGLSCTYSISPTSKSFDSSGGTSSVSVTVPDGCDWTGTSNDSWITIDSGSSGSGNGNGTVNYSVSENTSTEERTGTMMIAGNTFTVTQSGTTCTYYISPTSQSFDNTGGIGSVFVTATSGCSWTATSNDSWITITSGSSGSGNGTVNYSVSASTSSRTGTMTIADLTFTVTQNELTENDPVPDIKANNSDGPIVINTGDNLSVTVELDSGDRDSEDADWWVYATSPFGTYWFTLNLGWLPSNTPIRVYGGPLFNLSPYTVLNMSTLPVGDYNFNFAVDDNMDNIQDNTYADSVLVMIETE